VEVKMKNRNWKFGWYMLGIIYFLFLNGIICAQETPVNIGPPNEKTQVEQKNDLKIDNQQNAQEPVTTQKVKDANLPAQSDEKDKEKATTKVKQVKSSRPDLTKSNGARPPTIVRPSGSGIPKGAGKPGGAVGPGRR
jgi:hypothetical protein